MSAVGPKDSPELTTNHFEFWVIVLANFGQVADIFWKRHWSPRSEFCQVPWKDSSSTRLSRSAKLPTGVLLSHVCGRLRGNVWASPHCPCIVQLKLGI
jgi:hypothetical protein